jgi:3-oxoacyl-(acyl-carrier-protein) synthase III
MITLNTPAPVAHAGILGLGVFRPERVVTNDEICQKIDSNDEWIQERSGIIERRHAGANEHVVSMATAAARKALADAGITADQLDLVMVATVTHRYQTPSASVEVAAALGAANAAATDTSAACAGFCYGLGIADGMIRSGVAKYILLIGAEKLSEIVDFEDRGTAFLFADGAGAVIVGPTQVQGIGPTIWGADGTQLDAIIMEPDVFTAERTGKPSVLTMQGQQVFRWAVGQMGDVCVQAMTAAGVTVNDLAAFVPHQANNRITDALIKQLDLPDHVAVARDIAFSGNTSAASVPLALDRLRENGEVKSGDLVLMVGFGAGLVHAAQVALVP